MFAIRKKPYLKTKLV